jgi:hypothetical protein
MNLQSLFQFLRSHQCEIDEMQSKILQVKRNENVLDHIETAIASFNIKFFVVDLRVAEGHAVGLVDHFHSHLVFGRWLGHHDLDHLAIEEGGNHLRPLAHSGLAHEHNAVISDVVLQDLGDKTLEVGGECGEDAGNVGEGLLLIVGHEIIVGGVADLMSEADEGIVARSKDGDITKAVVLRLGEGTLESYMCVAAINNCIDFRGAHTNQLCTS